ncbi:MAG: hypothetical protein WA885_05430 [Phormidesmis sp.]
MGRRIISEQLQLESGASISRDYYGDRLMKYIPTESVGFWLAVSGMIQSAGDGIPKIGLLWLFFVIGLVFTFLYIRRQTQEPNHLPARTQIAISCGAFVVWVLAAGGPLTQAWSWYEPLYGSLLLITYTAAVGFIIPPEK